MKKKSFSFSKTIVSYYFDAEFVFLEKLVNRLQTIFIVDEIFFEKHRKKITGWQTIIIPSGEVHKMQQTVDYVIGQLIALGATRKTTLVGIGGGVITDITGYVAGIFMRGIDFGFVPTTVLSMTDAAIGGKNGINVGLYKNMVGLIRQPRFILYDYSLLKTLPKHEWVNGFAEIIKHACISDASMFKYLETYKLPFFQKSPNELSLLIQKNALIKTKIVLNDEFEKGERKLLNFGHTIGHGVENLYGIPHGQAVSVGIGVACKVSEVIKGFRDTEKVINLLKQYGLTPNMQFDKEAVCKLIMADKKASDTCIDFIVLDKIGKASVVNIKLDQLFSML